MNNGTIGNEGQINNMTYVAGAYSNHVETTYKYWWRIDPVLLEGYDAIGTLILAGDSTGIDWGDVENLQFDPNGKGVLTLTATGEEPLAFATMSNSVFCAISLPGISFTGIQAVNVDLTNGNIVLDLSGLNEEEIGSFFTDGFTLDDLFSGAAVTGNPDSLRAVVDESEITIFSNDEFAERWSIDPETGIISMETPEMPQNFQYADVTVDSVTLTWNAADFATYYVVEYQLAGADWSTYWYGSMSDTFTTIDNLREKTAYDFRVRAANDCVKSGWSQTITVTTLAKPPAGDYVVTTLVDTMTPAAGEMSLRKALTLAKAGEVIAFDSTMFDDGNAKTLTLALGELAININVSIIGVTDSVGNNLLTIQGDGKNRVISVAPKTGTVAVTLKNLTLTGGKHSSQGGALYVKNAQLSLVNVAITNSTANYGGAVYMTNSVVTVTDCTMSKNTGKWGGAIYQLDGALTIYNCAFANNAATWGGAIQQTNGN